MRRMNTSMNAVRSLAKHSLEDFKNAYKNLKDRLTDDVILGNSATPLPAPLGFTLLLPIQQDTKKPYILLSYENEKYLVEMGDTPAGNARRVINTLKSFQKIADKDKLHFDKLTARKEELQQLVYTPDRTYEEKLALCEKEIQELQELIAMRQEADEDYA